MRAMLNDLMTHAEWANAVFFKAWEKSPARDHEELRDRVHHILVVQESFLTVLGGGELRFPPDGAPPAFDELKSRAATVHHGLREVTAALDDTGIARTVHVPWFPDPPCHISVAQAVIQVALHTQHHRGQCMTRLKDFGGQPKNVDWIIWLWKQKPTGLWN